MAAATSSKSWGTPSTAAAHTPATETLPWPPSTSGPSPAPESAARAQRSVCWARDDAARRPIDSLLAAGQALPQLALSLGEFAPAQHAMPKEGEPPCTARSACSREPKEEPTTGLRSVLMQHLAVQDVIVIDKRPKAVVASHRSGQLPCLQLWQRVADKTLEEAYQSLLNKP